MPQMSPLSWWPLMIFSLTLIMMFSASLYWLPHPQAPKTLSPTPTKTPVWKW